MIDAPGKCTRRILYTSISGRFIARQDEIVLDTRLSWAEQLSEIYQDLFIFVFELLKKIRFTCEVAGISAPLLPSRNFFKE